MSSKYEVSRHRERPRSRSLERRRDHKSRETSGEKDKKSKSGSPSRSKHRSTSRDKKSKHKKEKKKKKKKKHSSSSSSSSSSDSDEEELKLLQRLEAERERLKEEKRKQKEQMKANETPEEKRARRLREKQEKERRRRERMGWDTEYQGYTNQDNPFGDSALTNTFVWSKKLAKEGVKTVSHDELEAQNRKKQLENKIELEKVKQRRLEREAERAAREAEALSQARAREAAQFSSWARQEDAFHLQQARLRSQIRIRDGRAKPIDLLAWYISSEECVDALEMHEPYTYLNGLQTQDLEDLLEDIKIFKGKTSAQLEALQTQIESKISGRRDGVDVGYWESLLSQLRAHRARARLRDQHQKNLRHKLQLLKQQQGVKTKEGDALERSQTPEPEAKQESSEAADNKTPDASDGEDGAEEACVALYRSGRYSPVLLQADKLEPATILTEPEDDAQRLAYLRARLHAANARQQHTTAAADVPAAAGPSTSGAPGSSTAALELAAARAMGPSADEAGFSVEHALPDAPCLWADKYRPRKPRYFNRVHTGFEWNKYNQTHYDMDNPPPKIVQGYKFNIFYPDLIDKSSTPEFSLKPCADNPEFAVLRFHAGPPYEDIAFKIVNREWEYSYKRGFRCHFHNNIFQLWFHFKRYRYRR